MNYLKASEIKVNRAARQRRKVDDIEGLAASIQKWGVLNPIILNKDNELIAGERRLEACRSLDPDFAVPFRYFESLDMKEMKIIELEENIKRKQLDWQDEVAAFAHIHELYCQLNASWSAEKTAGMCSISTSYLQSLIKVNRAIVEGNELVIGAGGIRAALNILDRQAARAGQQAVNAIHATVIGDEGEDADSINDYKPVPIAAAPGEKPAKPLPTNWAFSNQDFKDFARTYKGPKYDFLHCDFPYGIDHHKSDQGGTSRHAAYEDSPEVYWELCSTLYEYAENLLTPNANIMFWLSMKHYQATIDLFERVDPTRSDSPKFKVDRIPMVWYKSDNKGIIRDVKRTPRNVMEFCLLIRYGDMHIIKPVANCFAHPTSKHKALHLSEKPQAMLEHFFRMFVDENTNVLDPTCGGGSAIRAAHNLGANFARGMDIDPDNVEASHAGMIEFLTEETDDEDSSI